MLRNFKKLLSLFLSFCLILEQTAFAQAIDLSHYFAHNPAQAIQSDKFRPLHLRYISYDNQANDFKLLLDKGDFLKGAPEHQSTGAPAENGLPEDRLKQETQELMKYFFIGLALPNEKFWVNLRPDSPDNILDPDLEKTDIGRIFLEADLQLKKDTASFTSPQTPEGKAYWDKLYKKAGELFGTENITIPTLTRPWIVPNEIIIREATDNAYIYKATLKVMLEEDYLGKFKSQNSKSKINSKSEIQNLKQYEFSDPRLKELNQYSTQLIKELIIPKLTYQVNTSKRYAPLRQVYYSLILAQWFKQKYGSSGSIRASGTRASANSYIDLIDSGNLANFTLSQPYDKQSYFQQYQKSFKDGKYNLTEPVYTQYGQSIRRYMSGGIGPFNIQPEIIICSSAVNNSLSRRNYLEDVHYQRMEENPSRYTKAIYNPEQVLSDALAKLANITGSNAPVSDKSTIMVLGFGENWQELTLLARKFTKCKILGIDWLNKNIEEAKRHIEDRNVDLIQGDVRNVNLDNYSPVSLIYMSYVIDSMLYDDDIAAMNKIIEKLVSIIGREGFIMSVPANHITISLLKQNGLRILLNEGAGLKTVCIVKKEPNPATDQLQVKPASISPIVRFPASSAVEDQGKERLMSRFSDNMSNSSEWETYLLAIQNFYKKIAYQMQKWDKLKYPPGNAWSYFEQTPLKYYFEQTPIYLAVIGAKRSNFFRHKDTFKNISKSKHFEDAVKERLAKFRQTRTIQVINIAVIGAAYGQEPISAAIYFSERIKNMLSKERDASVLEEKILINIHVIDKSDIVYDKLKNNEIVYPEQLMRSYFKEEEIKLYFTKEANSRNYIRSPELEKYLKFYDVELTNPIPSATHRTLRGMDVVMVHNVLQHVKSKKNNIPQYLHALLKPGGILSIITQRFYGNPPIERMLKEMYFTLMDRKSFNRVDGIYVKHPGVSSIDNDKGGIAFNALPIQTEAVVSSSLGAFSGAKAFQGDLNAEWAQIQQVFNAGIRPSVQRISEYAAAAASSGLAGEKIEQVRSMLADILRSEEEDERLPATSADLKNLVSALES